MIFNFVIFPPSFICGIDKLDWFFKMGGDFNKIPNSSQVDYKMIFTLWQKFGMRANAFKIILKFQWLGFKKMVFMEFKLNK